LKTAVSLRKVSDVPVGVFLSGIDSSTNAALFSEGDSAPVKTFSIGYDRDYQSYTNELHYARQMAKTVGADHHERILNQQDLLSFLPEMIRLQDEPIADPVCVPVYYVSKLARENGVIVCQVGEGADELFNGYANWAIKLRLARYNDLPVPAALKQVGLTGLRMLGKDRRIEYDLLQRAAAKLPVVQGLDNMSHAYKLSLLSPRLREEYRRNSTWDLVKPIWDRFKDKAWEQGHLNWMSYLDLSIRLPELLLMRVDKMAMAVSLEGRVPFLDHKFVELAMSIPEAVKTRNNESKYILKKAVRGTIPDELIDRKAGIRGPGLRLVLRRARRSGPCGVNVLLWPGRLSGLRRRTAYPYRGRRGAGLDAAQFCPMVAGVHRQRAVARVATWRPERG
jgi:asparagine synthase (glutamine-hydrolysing)